MDHSRVLAKGLLMGYTVVAWQLIGSCAAFSAVRRLAQTCSCSHVRAAFTVMSTTEPRVPFKS